MLSREDRLLSEILVSRGLVAQETLERCARRREGSGDRRSLVDFLVDGGDIDLHEGERALEEARALDRSLTPEIPGGGRLGDFRLLREIGRGGMGIVYEAEQEPLGRHVALKVLPAGAALDERLAVRFLREVRAVARLDHPGIVRVFTSGREAGVLYFTMELVLGRALDRLIAEGPLDPGRAARIALEVARALEHAHQAGFIHRDIKPENILIADDGRTRLTDFGLVHEASEHRVTVSHMVLGTPAFIAPEQARGEPVDPRSDVYSLGAVLYAMLAGRPPYTGRVPAVVISRVLGETPPPLISLRPDVPVELAAVCGRALARDPEDRFQTAGEFAADLERYLHGEAPDAHLRQEVKDRARQRASRWRAARVAGVAGAALILVALAGLAMWNRARSPEGVAALPEPVIEGTFALLPSPPGPKSSPALSPDGQWIAYMGKGTGKWEIYLQHLPWIEAENLTAGSPGPNYGPAFSPDGTSLAFMSSAAPSGVHVLDLARRRLRPLGSPLGTHTAWSADGREIALSAWFFSGFAPLWVVEADSGRSRLLSSRGARQAHWSQGGSRIAFASTSGGSSDIWTIPARGEEAARVTQDAAQDWSPLWSPDGRFLYFGSDRNGGIGLWRVPVEESSGAPAGPPVRVTRAVFAASFEMAIGSDPRRLVLVGSGKQAMIHRLEFDPRGGTVARPPAGITRSALHTRFPQPAPDGRRIAYTEFVPGTGQENLRVAGADGLNPVVLTDEAFGDGAPRWSPDGGRIAFRSDRGGRMEVWSILPDGTGLTRLAGVPGADVTDPVWSPDGKRIAFGVVGGASYLADLSPDGAAGDPQPLATLDERVPFEPSSWSSDGRTLAGTAGGVWLYSIADGHYTRLTESGESPVWLPDGRRLLFVEGSGIELLDTGDGARRRVFTAEPNELHGSIGLSADGRGIYVSLASSDEALWELKLAAEAAASAQGVR